MNNKIKKNTAEIIYLFLIFFFCYTAFNKLLNIEAFRTNLMKTSIFNEFYANLISVTVICFEIVIILVLYFRKTLGLLILSFTLITFTVYISYLNFKGFYEVCGCGGILNGLSYKFHLLINILLLVFSIYSYYTLMNLKNEK